MAGGVTATTFRETLKWYSTYWARLMVEHRGARFGGTVDGSLAIASKRGTLPGATGAHLQCDIYTQIPTLLQCKQRAVVDYTREDRSEITSGRQNTLRLVTCRGAERDAFAWSEALMIQTVGRTQVGMTENLFDTWAVKLHKARCIDGRTRTVSSSAGRGHNLCRKRGIPTRFSASAPIKPTRPDFGEYPHTSSFLPSWPIYQIAISAAFRA